MTQQIPPRTTPTPSDLNPDPTSFLLHSNCSSTPSSRTGPASRPSRARGRGWGGGPFSVFNERSFLKAIPPPSLFQGARMMIGGGASHQAVPWCTGHPTALRSAIPTPSGVESPEAAEPASGDGCPPNRPTPLCPPYPHPVGKGGGWVPQKPPRGGGRDTPDPGWVSVPDPSPPGPTKQPDGWGRKGPQGVRSSPAAPCPRGPGPPGGADGVLHGRHLQHPTPPRPWQRARKGWGAVDYCRSIPRLGHFQE